MLLSVASHLYRQDENRGTKDEKGKVIGLGTIAKKLGISKDKLSYLFRKYENNQL